jgi:hypothetical protein
MLYIINSPQDPLINLVADDPVRPEIPAEFRVSADCEIAVWRNRDTHEPEAVVCIAYRDRAPQTVLELAEHDVLARPNVAVFYTIWSYRAGSGQRLLREACRHIRQERPDVTRFVTMSPKTDLARRFHLRNGAQVLQTNLDTVNYEYLVLDQTKGD